MRADLTDYVFGAVVAIVGVMIIAFAASVFVSGAPEYQTCHCPKCEAKACGCTDCQCCEACK